MPSGPGRYRRMSLSLHVFQDLVASPCVDEIVIAGRLSKCPSHEEGHDKEHEDNGDVVALRNDEPEILARFGILDPVGDHGHEREGGDRDEKLP